MQMICWNAPFKVEQIEKLALIAALPPHHGKPPPLKLSRQRNHCSPKITSLFSTPSVESECGAVAVG
jgi:hypothetical protein